MTNHAITQRYKSLFLGLLLAFTLLLPATTSAQETSESLTLEAQIVVLKETLNQLVSMMQARSDYYAGASSAITVDAETSQWFFVRQSADNDSRIFGDFDASLVIEADGGTTQLLVETTCADSGLILANATTCLNHQWLTASEFENGVRTYTIPMRAISSLETEEFSVTVRACRFNGCDDGITIPVFYKEAQTFADTVEIYDRYEWEYEWDGDDYHVQEVLLSFPADEVKKIKARVYCDVSGIFTDPEEDTRLGCNTKQNFTRPDYREVEIDEQGNVYNMRLESVSKNFFADAVGKIEFEFVFFGHSNRVLHTAYHSPLQLESEEVDES